MRWRVGLIVAVVVSGVVIQGRPWNWPWGSMWMDVGRNAGLLLACFGAGLGTALALARRPARSGRTSPWLLSYPGVATVVAAVLALGVAALAIMLRVAGEAAVADRPKLQIDAIKYGLGIFAGAGAVAALLLSIRRQQHLEHAQEQIEQAQRHVEFDAAQRRITDLYTKAVEQLGHDDAAVRLGGLYALERVAQNNPTQRQTVVDVLCAYLRMPFTPAAEPPDEQPATDGRDPKQEIEVRRAAQRIVTTHLTLPADANPDADIAQGPEQPFWSDIDLDLTGAYLVQWSMGGCRVRRASFERAEFASPANFHSATFTHASTFMRASFTDFADFPLAHFGGPAVFYGVTFGFNAHFGETVFAEHVNFGQSTFHGRANFNHVVFSDRASFESVTFSEKGQFVDAVFTGFATFWHARFFGNLDLERTSFSDVDFRDALFFAPPGFDWTDAERGVVLLPGWQFAPDRPGVARVVRRAGDQEPT